MLTMFVLFVALYLVERDGPDPVAVPSQIAASPPRLSPEKTPERTIPESPFGSSLHSLAGVELTQGRGARIVLMGDLLFESGGAEVRPVAMPVLERVAEAIRRAPPHLKKIHVSGHSDEIPIHNTRFPSNWELSSARASAVTRILIDTFALEGARFVVSAHAHHRPRDTAAGALARSRNRRVEILLKEVEL